MGDMTDSAELRRLLEEMARDAPPASAVPVARLRRSIQRQRSIQAVVTGAAAVAIVTLFTGIALTVMDGGRASPSGSPSSPVPGGIDIRRAQCGDRVAALAAGGEAPVRVEGDFPAVVPLAAGGVLEGSVTVTNTGDDRLTGVTSTSPDMLLVGDVVVGTPLPVRDAGEPVDLMPGDSQTFAAYVSLERCAAGQEPGQSEWAELPATALSGSYEVCALWHFTAEGGGTLIVPGGPWPVELH